VQVWCGAESSTSPLADSGGAATHSASALCKKPSKKSVLKYINSKNTSKTQEMAQPRRLLGFGGVKKFLHYCQKIFTHCKISVFTFVKSSFDISENV